MTKKIVGIMLMGLILSSCKSYPSPDSAFNYSSIKTWIANIIIQNKSSYNNDLHYLYWSRNADQIMMDHPGNITICNTLLKTNDCQIIRIYNTEDVKIENIEFYVKNYPYKDPSELKVQTNNSNNGNWNDENTEILKKLERAEDRRIKNRQLKVACQFLGTC